MVTGGVGDLSPVGVSRPYTGLLSGIEGPACAGAKAEIESLRLSTKGQYAVRAMVNLACHSGDNPVTLKDISEDEGISLSYLEQLFVKLRKGKVVKSVRGPGGGYVLAKPSDRISVGEIIAVVEEPLNPVACLDTGAMGCERANKCTTQSVWKGLAVRIADFLNSITIKDLVDEASNFSAGGQAVRNSPQAGKDLCNISSK